MGEGKPHFLSSLGWKHLNGYKMYALRGYIIKSVFSILYFPFSSLIRSLIGTWLTCGDTDMFLCCLANEELYYMSVYIWYYISGSDRQMWFTIQCFSWWCSKQMPCTDIIGVKRVYHNGKIFIQRLVGLQKQHLNNTGFSTAPKTFVSFSVCKE